MEELSKLRDDLYESIPNGKMDTFDLIRVINNHLMELDELIELKKLTIHDVSGRSEQLKCEHKGRITATELVEYCEDCKKILFHP